MASDFCYAGRDAEGRLLKGTIIAADKAEAAVLLRRRKIWATDIRPASASGRSFWRKGVSARDLGRFCGQLAALVQAGVALGNAVNILGRQTSNAEFRRTMETVGARLGEGVGLADAFRSCPHVFSPLFCSMAAAGEMSGQLGPVMERLGAYYARRHSFRSKVVAAVTYPTLILMAAVLVFAVLLVYILPSFHSMLMTLNVPLPASTTVVFAVSRFVQAYFPVLVAVPLLAVFFGWRAWRGEARGRVELLISRLPVIGPLYLAAVMAGMCRTLGGLATSGVPILKALDVVTGMAGHGALAPILDRARLQVAEGVPLADIFRREALIPGIVPEVLAIGEETGELGFLLDRLADYFDQEADSRITTITTLLEPLLILVIGVVVGLILLSVLLPMFDAVWSIQ